MVLNEASLRRIIRSYFQYYERSRTHLALEKDAQNPEQFTLQNLVSWSSYRRWFTPLTAFGFVTSLASQTKWRRDANAVFTL
jgi:hypothetical protein